MERYLLHTRTHPCFELAPGDHMCDVHVFKVYT